MAKTVKTLPRSWREYQSLVTPEFLRCLEEARRNYSPSKDQASIALHEKAQQKFGSPEKLKALLIIQRAITNFRDSDERKEAYKREKNNLRRLVYAKANAHALRKAKEKIEGYTVSGIERLETYVQIGFLSRCGNSKGDLSNWRYVGVLLEQMKIATARTIAASDDSSSGRRHYMRLRSRTDHHKENHKGLPLWHTSDVFFRHLALSPLKRPKNRR